MAARKRPQKRPAKQIEEPTDRPEGAQPAKPAKADPPQATTLRIVGGMHRGRSIAYHGDPRTRPMKDRVREAAFNLIGDAVEEKLVFDLFAGTGALALEALSRGAADAILIERHLPTARLARENAASLGLSEQAEVISADAFYWVRQCLPEPKEPWLAFFSPPFDFYIERQGEMREMIDRFATTALPASVLVVEADLRFSADLLPEPSAWDVRTYPPAQIAIRFLE